MLVQTGGSHTIAEMAEAVWQQMRKKGLESFQDGTAIWDMLSEKTGNLSDADGTEDRM